MPFIVFEGIDGAGKDTLISLFAEWLEKNGQHVHVTAEPGSVFDGGIRNILMAWEMEPKTEALLFVADRYEHFVTEIAPLLEARVWVLSSRYVYSTFAYQGSKGLSLSWIAELHKQVFSGVSNWIPLRTFFIDTPPDVAWERLKTRRDLNGRYEVYEYLKNVYKTYKMGIYSKLLPGEITILDGHKTPQQLLRDVVNDLSPLLREVHQCE